MSVKRRQYLKSIEDPDYVPSKLGRKPGSTTKEIKNARQAIALFVDSNSDRMSGWLEEIYEREGPKAAFSCFMELVEYHVPKLARTEMVGKDEGPVELVITWAEGK